MLIKNANVYVNAKRCFEKKDILIADGIIADIGKLDGADTDIFDADGQAAVAGLIDVHTHGRTGYDFNEADGEALHAMAKDYAAHGVTAVMPTLASAPLEQMAEAAGRACGFSPYDNEAALLGIHLEGRYLNPNKKGAHARHLISGLFADELDIFAKYSPLHVSAAYELDADGSFSAKALAIGATLGLGHTEADYAQARLAEQRGVTAYTHLFNAMPALHHRDGGAVCAALTGNAYAELICDGIHVAPQMIKLAYSMLGAERTVLISDSMEATGCPDGDGYSICGNAVTVKNGVPYTTDGALAGSTLTLDRAVNNLIDFCGIPLSDAILCATENPAKEIGCFDRLGSIDVGKRADILFLKSAERLDIDRIMIRGKFI